VKHIPSLRPAAAAALRCALGVALFAGAAAASAPPSVPQRGTNVVVVGAGVGVAHEIGHSVVPAHFFAATLGYERYLSDRFALGVEGVPLFALTQDGTAYGMGLTVTGHHLLARRKQSFTPFAEWGAGFLHFNREEPLNTVRFDFTLRLGVGGEWSLGPGRTVTAGYRFHHISNAGRGETNPGINSSYPYVEMGLLF